MLFNVRIVFILREKGVALRFTTAVFASSQAIADPNLKNCDTPLVVLHPEHNSSDLYEEKFANQTHIRAGATPIL